MSKKSKASKSTVKQTNTFEQDYSNTKRDLKRIGLLAGIFIIFLVVLSFFQNQLLALFIK